MCDGQTNTHELGYQHFSCIEIKKLKQRKMNAIICRIIDFDFDASKISLAKSN
jgi:hypothetical protein